MLPIGDGHDREICAVCEEQMELFYNTEAPGALKSTINYLYTCAHLTGDPEVAAFLREAVEANCAEVDELDLKQVKNQAVSLSNTRDYFEEKRKDSSLRSE
ncbi:MAG: hypothetical protein FWC62_06120 [Firmicutes bacterium]|nr:hypothetical protein [Bacillota bacterium]